MNTNGMIVKQVRSGFSIICTEHNNTPLGAITYRTQSEAQQVLATLSDGGMLNPEGRAVSRDRLEAARRMYDQRSAEIERHSDFVVNGEWPTWPL